MPLLLIVLGLLGLSLSVPVVLLPSTAPPSTAAQNVPVQVARAFTVTSTATPITLSTSDWPTSGVCLVPSDDPVYLVPSTTTTGGPAGGPGPFCTDATACPAGAWVPIAGKAYLATANGAPSVDVRCSLVDGGGGFGGVPSTATPAGGGGGGAVGALGAVQLSDGAGAFDDASPATLSWGVGGLTSSRVVTAPQLYASSSDLTTPALSNSANTDTGIDVAAASDIVRVVTSGVTRFLCATTTASCRTFNVQLMGSVGASSPAIAFDTDSLTGIDADGSGNLSFWTNNAARATINSVGFTSTVPVIVPLGTATATAVAPTGDANTGLFSTGADNLSFATGGTSRMSIATTRIDAFLPIGATNGTAAAPGLTFASESGMGLSRISAGVMGLSTAAAERARVSSAGLTMAAGTSVLATTDNTQDLGSSTVTWNEVFAQSLVGKTTGGVALTITDPDGVTMTGAANITLDSASGIDLASSRIRAPTSATTVNLLRLPSTIGTVPDALPTCTASLAGATTYLDDTDDGKPAVVCICGADAANAYSWSMQFSRPGTADCAF